MGCLTGNCFYDALFYDIFLSMQSMTVLAANVQFVLLCSSVQTILKLLGQL